ncbi:MAG: prolyl oligopeptidase family serine peptidase [Planctomycetaceae bacterium]
MSFNLRTLLAILLCASGAWGANPIPRRLPPVGIEIPQATLQELAAEVAGLDTAMRTWEESAPQLLPLAPDVAIYLKAVRFALLHGEFWQDVETDWAKSLLDVARRRLEALRRNESPWTTEDGMVFRGFRSALDGSVQPYGLHIPSGLDQAVPAPLYVYLHGRREKMVELQFLEQIHEVGRIEAPGTYVLHAFGRYCNGYKAAGEVDIREAVAHVSAHYAIDPNRIAITGFSTGGAGVWHLAAHYPDLWVAASPGAGFSETAVYNQLEPADYPAWYEQKLWGLYDAPAYVRNLFQMDVIAYSGEHDRQAQASHIMAEAYQQNGRKLTHIVGPDTGHKYHPESRLEILHLLATAAKRGLDRDPEEVTLQTRTLRYDRCRWVRIDQLERHWVDSRVDARQRQGRIEISTRNVAALEINARSGYDLAGAEVAIDNATFRLSDNASQTVMLRRNDGVWSPGEQSRPTGLHKIHGLQGPIDDAFLDPFLVVTPGDTSSHPDVESWVQFELHHFLERWRRLFRGDVRVKKDVDVTADDMSRYHLILWGDPSSNQMLSKVLPYLPLHWTRDTLSVGSSEYSASNHVPVLVYPNPLAPDRYVVLNSGMTFREGHDRTNSLQNPKLPDWAVLSLHEAPNAETAGRVVAAEFFDERWQVNETRPRED